MKDSKDVISEFNEYVNMTASELETWLKSDDSNSAGWPKDEGEGGESVGHDSGRKIVEILEANPDKDPEKYTDDQVQHMRKVASYCKRHLAQESAGNKEKDPEDVKKTKSYASLKNWGHDFLKAQGKAGSGNKNGSNKQKKDEGDEEKKEEEEAADAADKAEEDDAEEEYEPHDEEDGQDDDKENGGTRRKTRQQTAAAKNGSNKSNGKKQKKDEDEMDVDEEKEVENGAEDEEEEEEKEGEGDEEEADKKTGDKRKKNGQGQKNGANKKRQTAKGKGPKKDEEEGKDDDQEGKDDEEEEQQQEDDDGDEADGGDDSKDKSSKKGPKKGETVSWNWGSGNPKGKVLDVKGEKTSIETKNGNEVSRDGDPEDPAVVLDTGKSKAIKSAHELN